MLEVGNFPREWRITSIGDIATVKGGKRLPKGSALTSQQTSHPYLRIVDFRDGTIDESALEYVPEDVFPAIRRYTISSSDIYVSIVGTIGLVGTIPRHLDGASLTENAAKLCKLSPEANRDFVAYFLRSNLGQQLISEQTVGSTQPKLALFRIANIKIPLPPLPEQRAIAHILGSLDDKIELNRQMNQTLEEMARAIFQSWFVDFDPVHAKARGEQPVGMDEDTAALFPDHFTDSDLGPIPAGWRLGTLDTVANITSGKRPAERSTTPTDDLRIPLYGGGGQMGYVAEPLHNTPLIITGRVGTLGQAFRISFPVWPSDNTLLLLPRERENLEFIYFTMSGIDFSSLNRGSTQPLLAQKDLKRHEIACPPSDVLTAFHNIAGELFELIDHNTEVNQTLAELRDTLLPKLMSGELRVPEAVEMAEAL